MADEVRIGVIGTGFARLTQIPSFLECEDAEIVSVASAKLANAEKAATKFGIAHFTNDWKQTVGLGDVDLISITAPPNLHREMTLYSLEHGKHVLCEKPMAMNMAEAAEMSRLANEKGLMALIDHELRFLNGRRIAFEMIRSGEIGKVLHFKQMFRNGSRGTAGTPWNWWSDIDSGGGALGAIGSHAIDTVHWFLGTDITDVFCLLKTHISGRRDADGRMRPVTADDEANMIFKFADSKLTQNASGTASISMVEAGNYDHNLKIFGTKGAIRVGESGEVWISGIGEGSWTSIEVDLGRVPDGSKVSGWTRGFLGFAREIVKALKEGKTHVPHAATFNDGVKVQNVLDAARASNLSGRMERLR
jgi:predicted dehydrogenase